MPCKLLTAPVELLVQHILARLDPPTLRSCSSTCKHLNVIIKASALLQYLIKLQELNLIDNPNISYSNISLARRMEVLREYGERQGIKWKANAAVLPKQLLSEPRSIIGEAGVLYVLPRSELEGHQLHWTILPSKQGQAIKWNIICPSNRPTANIAAHAQSIEENDLIAIATRHEEPQAIHGNSSFFQIQIHLIQHSTQLPYPALTSPILDICAFQRLRYGDYPLVNLAIRGTNLAVMVGHECLEEIMDQEPYSWFGHLSVWNWKTGEKKCENNCIPDKDMNLVFLSEDFLLHGSSLTPSLNIYHIPTSTPSVGDHEFCQIQCLGFPTLRTSLHDRLDPDYSPEYNLDISFLNNPSVIPSFTESSSPTSPRLFAPDTLSSILPIKVTFDGHASSASYLFITHYRTLLDRAEDALSRCKSGQAIAERLVPWEEWGPDLTKMFWYNDDRYSFDAPYGSRLFIHGDDLIEVYDFGCADGTNGPNQGHEESQTQRSVHWLVEQDKYRQRGWFQDIVQTKLPFVRWVLKGSIGGHWDMIYVDHSRIVGIGDDGLNMLFIG